MGCLKGENGVFEKHILHDFSNEWNMLLTLEMDGCDSSLTTSINLMCFGQRGENICPKNNGSQMDLSLVRICVVLCPL